jgi:hypothetical protein
MLSKMKESEINIETILIDKDKEIDRLRENIKVYEKDINQLKFNIDDISSEFRNVLADKDEELSKLNERYDKTVKEVVFI